MNEIIKDLTTVKNAIIAHGCNCGGGFGSGIAGAIRKKWPEVYLQFKKNGTGVDLLGTIDALILQEGVTVINCYTQLFYGPGDKKYADLTAIDSAVRQACKYAQIAEQDLYIAKIGAGLGGLSWEDEVKPLYEIIFAEFPDVNIFVCDIT